MSEPLICDDCGAEGAILFGNRHVAGLFHQLCADCADEDPEDSLVRPCSLCGGEPLLDDLIRCEWCDGSGWEPR